MYSVIIVDYNSISDTMHYISHCVDKMVEVSQIHFVVVDNMPVSTCKHVLNKEFNIIPNTTDYCDMEVFEFLYKGADVRILQVGYNAGYAKGNNIGIAYSANEWNDSYILISNNDIQFEKEIHLEILKKILEDSSNIAVVGPRVEDSNGNLQGPYYQSTAWQDLVERPSKIIPRLLIKRKSKTQNEIFNKDGVYYWVSGCFFLCSRDKMQAVGNFDENTFLYAEEMILTERLKRLGYCMYYTNEMSVVHRSSETIGKSFKNLEAEQVLFDSLYYYHKQYKKAKKVVLWLAKINFNFVKFLFKVGQIINQRFGLIDV